MKELYQCFCHIFTYYQLKILYWPFTYYIYKKVFVVMMLDEKFPYIILA